MHDDNYITPGELVRALISVPGAFVAVVLAMVSTLLDDIAVGRRARKRLEAINSPTARSRSRVILLANIRSTWSIMRVLAAATFYILCAIAVVVALYQALNLLFGV